MNDTKSPAIQFLEEKGIPHTTFQHSHPIHSLEQAASERNQQPEQVVRSIVFRLSEEEYLMVLMPGPGQIPWKELRRHLGQSRMTMANEEELLQSTGYRPGTVTPFGLPAPMRILVDQGILKQPEVSLGSGRRGLAIMMLPENILQALDSAGYPHEIVNFSGE